MTRIITGLDTGTINDICLPFSLFPLFLWQEVSGHSAGPRPGHWAEAAVAREARGQGQVGAGRVDSDGPRGRGRSGHQNIGDEVSSSGCSLGPGVAGGDLIGHVKCFKF